MVLRGMGLTGGHYPKREANASLTSPTVTAYTWLFTVQMFFLLLPFLLLLFELISLPFFVFFVLNSNSLTFTTFLTKSIDASSSFSSPSSPPPPPPPPVLPRILTSSSTLDVQTVVLTLVAAPSSRQHSVASKSSPPVEDSLATPSQTQVVPVTHQKNKTLDAVQIYFNRIFYTSMNSYRSKKKAVTGEYTSVCKTQLCVLRSGEILGDATRESQGRLQC